MNEIKNLNEKQYNAYKIMENGENIFLSGPGGVGKSHIIKLFNNIYSRKKKIAICSSTGISALLIGGTTLHSYLGLGLGDLPVDKLLYKIMMKKMICDRWKKLDVLIIDEVSMITPELFDKIEECFRIIRKNDEPFGGVQIILSGDFLQLPCVKNDSFVFESNSWKHITNNIFLDEIVRQKDTDFQIMLNEIRIGKISAKTKDMLLSRLVKFRNEFHNIKPTILFSTNKDVDSYNKKKIEELNSSETFQYESQVKMVKKILEDDVAKYKRGIGISDNLELCRGAQVMLIYNIDITNGLVNGSRGVVKDFNEDSLPIVKFKNGVEIEINFQDFEINENGNNILTITQIPLKIAYALTIHKCQGAELDLVVMNLGDVFEYGQAYVALSRIRDLNSLYLTEIDFDKIVANPKALKFYGLEKN